MPMEAVITVATPVVVLTTLPLDVDAAAFARALVSARLAACVSVLGPMRSVYRWQDSIEDAEERQVVIKTVVEQVPALEARVRALHPYEVPEFLVLPVSDGGARYLAWIRDSTTV
jgi:periplasmic divalent cation tolerance protein